MSGRLQCCGDHGGSEFEVASASESSDLKPECCEGKRKTGEGFSLFSKSSREAVSEGCESNMSLRAPVHLVAIFIATFREEQKGEVRIEDRKVKYSDVGYRRVNSGKCCGIARRQLDNS